MESFDFITDEDFRKSLETDFAEMKNCVEVKAWKAVHVIAGSIIEAVLIDYLLAEHHVTRSEALKLDFGKAIALGKEKNVLSSKTFDLTSVIKEYRNLIHPGRVIRLKEKVNGNSAQVACSLVDIVMEEISSKKYENYGYTAEQIVSKLERDSSANAIIMHLLKSLNEKEIERLLLKVLPEKYMEWMQSEFVPDHLLTSMRICFREAINQAPDELKYKVAAKFIVMLKEESDSVITAYSNAFFKCNDICGLKKDDIAFVIAHILTRLDIGIDNDLIDMLEGISHLLNKDDMNSFLDPLIKKIVYKSDNSIKTKCKNTIINEYYDMDTKLKEHTIKRLQTWGKFLEEKDNSDGANKLLQLKIELEDSDNDIPF